MDTTSLKEYIHKENKIELILEEIGCHHIKYHSTKDYYSCGNYNGDNPSAVNVYNNKYLTVYNWTRVDSFGDKSDIITLVEYNKNLSFIEAIKYLHKVLGLKYDLNFKPKIKPKENPLDIFTKFRHNAISDTREIQSISEEVINDYVPLLHIDFFREGIMPKTAKRFGLAYSYKKKRVIIPLRYWLTGELVGLNMRTTIKAYKELGIPKYFISPTYPKTLNLYGLWENYDEIQRKKYVVVYESEKSVLKRDSRFDGTGVAIQGHSLSPEQARILIGLDVDIIIAMDKDISVDECRHICEKIYPIRNVYYIFDKYDLLKEKQSPADASNKVFNFLIKNCLVKYDKTEHEKYLSSLKRKE